MIKRLFIPIILFVFNNNLQAQQWWPLFGCHDGSISVGDHANTLYVDTSQANTLYIGGGITQICDSVLDKPSHPYYGEFLYYKNNQFYVPEHTNWTGEPYAITKWGDSLIVGGLSGSIGCCIKQLRVYYNNNWYPLPGPYGTNRVTSLCKFKDSLYFSMWGTNWPVSNYNLGCYNGSSAYNLPIKLGETVYTMESIDSLLLIGGSFYKNQPICPENKYTGICAFNGDSLIPFGTTARRVTDFEIYNNELYSAGIFIDTVAQDTFTVAKWNGNDWIKFGGNFFDSIGLYSTDCIAECFKVIDNKLFIAVSYYNKTDAYIVYTYDGTNIVPFGKKMFNAYITSLEYYNNELIIGGNLNYKIGTEYFHSTAMRYTNDTLSGVELLSTKENNFVNLYPNPALNTLNVSINNLHYTGQATLLNSLGQSIITRKITDTNFTIDLSTLSNGIYLLQLQVEKEIINKKIVVQH